LFGFIIYKLTSDKNKSKTNQKQIKNKSKTNRKHDTRNFIYDVIINVIANDHRKRGYLVFLSPLPSEGEG